METGRTSSVGNDILGFDSSGNVVNQPEHGSLGKPPCLRKKHVENEAVQSVDTPKLKHVVGKNH